MSSMLHCVTVCYSVLKCVCESDVFFVLIESFTCSLESHDSIRSMSVSHDSFTCVTLLYCVLSLSPCESHLTMNVSLTGRDTATHCNTLLSPCERHIFFCHTPSQEVWLSYIATSFTCVTLLYCDLWAHMSHKTHVSHVNVCHAWMCDTFTSHETHPHERLTKRVSPHVWQDSCLTRVWDIFTSHKTHVTCVNVWHNHVSQDSFTWETHSRVWGWLRLVGSLKSDVSFAKESYKRDDMWNVRNANVLWVSHVNESHKTP